ncbi:MAG: GDP-mannose 4,6-dehydratase [Parvibaculum sp.]|uniref:GDP-mannose 4,6-dehydratase n=1 Tax=Parvibaculum sp. TaxID=2024848 RepID=UPI0028418007|nr:GDP-mannose 4,6-dehydratase [Parvibaculum sp.]MDR3499416.1 GDP-mannose 4,6-dehydratase [Parvibaculum sp.]
MSVFPLRDQPRSPVALITGITGQDGGYLAELLLERGYVVHGMARDVSRLERERFAGVADINHRLILHSCDMTDGDQVHRLVREVTPDEVYNLAAQTHIQTSFDDPAYTADVNATGPMRLLNAIIKLDPERRTRFYQASSSEMFGDARGRVQNEETPLHPLNPYAVSKHAAFEATVNFREAYGLHASNGILFNHESPYRNPSFVTRKISLAVAAWHVGEGACLKLGNLDTRRDWGHAADYVHGMWLMLQQPQPGDYVLATGENHSVREFVELAFKQVGRNIVWRGAGLEETGIDAQSGDSLVAVDPKFFRPTELSGTLGDATRARSVLGWKTRVSFPSLVNEMVEADILRLESGRLIQSTASD